MLRIWRNSDRSAFTTVLKGPEMLKIWIFLRLRDTEELVNCKTNSFLISFLLRYRLFKTPYLVHKFVRSRRHLSNYPFLNASRFFCLVWSCYLCHRLLHFNLLLNHSTNLNIFHLNLLHLHHNCSFWLWFILLHNRLGIHIGSFFFFLNFVLIKLLLTFLFCLRLSFRDWRKARPIWYLLLELRLLQLLQVSLLCVELLNSVTVYLREIVRLEAIKGLNETPNRTTVSTSKCLWTRLFLNP